MLFDFKGFEKHLYDLNKNELIKLFLWCHMPGAKQDGLNDEQIKKCIEIVKNNVEKRYDVILGDIMTSDPYDLC